MDAEEVIEVTKAKLIELLTQIHIQFSSHAVPTYIPDVTKSAEELADELAVVIKRLFPGRSVTRREKVHFSGMQKWRRRSK